jgi:hypothetical protein
MEHQRRLLRQEIERAWERSRHGEADGAVVAADTVVRPEIAESWSLAHVDPARDSAPSCGDADVATRWHESALRQPVSELSDELGRIADDAGFVVAVTDETGTILWTSGCRAMRRRIEAVNFMPGGCWSEDAIGTNALGLALRTDQPSTVFSAEHMVERLHDWVCYSAPIHDPRGRQLGVIDLSSTWERANALGLTTVRMLTSTIESRLRDTWTGGEQVAARVDVRCLGRPQVLVDGLPVHVTLRQSEILALLALRPAGYSPGELAAEIYGDRCVAPGTLKCEVSHVRRLLGGQLAARTYALLEPVSCDAVAVLQALSRGDVTTAVEHYNGPLLPESDAPGIVAWRDQLEVAIRDAVLRSKSADSALRLGAVNLYDSEVHTHALRLLAPTDRRRHLAMGRLHAAESL